MTAALVPFELAGPAGRLAGWAAAGVEPPVLYLHPINTAGRVWEDVVAALGPARRSLLLDLRGHGGSAGGPSYRVDDYVADALAALDARGVERAHVVGGSLGGPIAAVLAAGAPGRVVSIAAFGSALAISVPPADLEGMVAAMRAQGLETFFRALAPGILAPGADGAIVERLVELAGGRALDTVEAITRAAFSTDVRVAAAGSSAPALVVTGEHDPTCPPEAAGEMARIVGGELVVMKGTGHLPMLERPAEVARLLAGHFARAEEAS